MPAKETTAKAIANYLLTFLESKNMDITKMRGLGLKGANTMSGKRSGVQLRLRQHSPSAIYVHCRCHQLQLAAVNAANEQMGVKRVLGTLLSAKHFTTLQKKQRSWLRYKLS